MGRQDGVCEGCGKTNNLDTYEIVPKVSVKLCWVYRSVSGSERCPPKGSCVEKAIKKMRRCPGCGAPDVDMGKICWTCRGFISGGKTLKQAEEKAKALEELGARERKVSKYAVIYDAVIPSRLQHEFRAAGHEVGALLAQAFGEAAGSESWIGPGTGTPRIPPNQGPYRGSSGSEHVNVSTFLLAPSQIEAVSQIYEAVERLVARTFQAGVERGGKTMLRLAAGEITSDAYDAEVKRQQDLADDVVESTLRYQAGRKTRG